MSAGGSFFFYYGVPPILLQLIRFSLCFGYPQTFQLDCLKYLLVIAVCVQTIWMSFKRVSRTEEKQWGKKITSTLALAVAASFHPSVRSTTLHALCTNTIFEQRETAHTKQRCTRIIFQTGEKNIKNLKISIGNFSRNIVFTFRNIELNLI